MTRYTLGRLDTGIAKFDAALDGGFPTGSTTVIAGASGTGKTVFALQTAFHAARQGMRCLYFTTLSEPAPKLIRYMQLYEFFDDALLHEKVVISDLGSSLRERGVDAALSNLVERVESESPQLVVVDSFKAIHDLMVPGRQRGAIYELAVAVAGWGATTMLIGEYTEAEIDTLPEFAIADAIVHLSSTRSELALVRQLEIRKLRGSGFATGVHFYDLGPHGITFYPRVTGPEQPDRSTVNLSERISTGVPGLDELLGGGLPRASSTVVLGGTGTGKTLLGLGFLVEGARHREPSLALMLEETPAQLREIARVVGWDLAGYERDGTLALWHSSPVELSTDRFLHDALEKVARIGARRVLLDSLTTLQLGTTSNRRFKELVYALIKHLRASDATLVMPMETPEIIGALRIAGSGLSFAADNLIYMRHFEHAGRLGRALAVLKARGVRHSSAICGMTIGSGGIAVGEPMRGFGGASMGPEIIPEEAPHRGSRRGSRPP